MAETAIEQVTENFDCGDFMVAYADELGADPEAAGWLEELAGRTADLGEGFEGDKRCQWLTVNLQHRAKAWDINRSHAAWKEANPEKYAEWQAANEAIAAAKSQR